MGRNFRDFWCSVSIAYDKIGKLSVWVNIEDGCDLDGGDVNAEFRWPTDQRLQNWPPIFDHQSLTKILSALYKQSLHIKLDEYNDRLSVFSGDVSTSLITRFDHDWPSLTTVICLDHHSVASWTL